MKRETRGTWQVQLSGFVLLAGLCGCGSEAATGPGSNGCEDCDVGPVCHQAPVELKVGDAAALIALDRSCSMRENVAGVRKWDSAVAGVSTMVSGRPDVRWGLTLFPDQVLEGDTSSLSYYDGWSNEKCDLEEIAVPVDTDTGLAIEQLLAGALDKSHEYFPDDPCRTPIDSVTLQAALDLIPRAQAEPELDYSVVLITDGKQVGNCNGGNEGTERYIDQLFAAGIRTYVVGFGGNVNKKKLDLFAERGGTARGGEHSYYQADDGVELAAMLTDISASLGSCSFGLTDVPEVDSELIVTAGGKRIVDGFHYDRDRHRVEFDDDGPSSLCARIQSGDSDVVVGFTCPAPDVVVE